MDPITLIVTALAAGAAAGMQGTVQQVVADAYSGLKEIIKRKYAGISTDQLEAAPDSKARQAVVEEDLGKTGAGQDPEVLLQAQALLDAIRAHAPEAAATVGVSLEDIKGASLRLADIVASGGGPTTGVSVKGAEIHGDIDISGVRATGGKGAGAGDEPTEAPSKG